MSQEKITCTSTCPGGYTDWKLEIDPDIDQNRVEWLHLRNCLTPSWCGTNRAELCENQPKLSAVDREIFQEFLYVLEWKI